MKHHHLKINILAILVAIPCLASLVWGLPAGPAAQKSHATDTIGYTNAEVMNNPNRYAWETFCKVTEPRPATPKRAGWDSWISAFRLYADPTQFNFANVDEKPFPGGDSFQILQVKYLQRGTLRQPVGAPAAVSPPPSPETPRAPAAPPAPTPAGDAPEEDVLLNPAAEEYVLEQGLISHDREEEMAAHGQPIDFPTAAIEMKVRWIKLTNLGDRDRYYTKVDPSGAYWGAQSIHITTKDIPNWFWATFEHEDNYRNGPAPFPSTDTWGFVGGQITPRLVRLFAAHHIEESVWRHYRLGGAQTDFTDGTGRPIFCGNNEIEGLLAGSDPAHQSSCMTCHALSTVNATIPPTLDPPHFGVPDWKWFYAPDAQGHPGRLTSVPRDFVWSLSRAKHKNGDPEFHRPEGIFWALQNHTQIAFYNDIRPLFLQRDVALLKKENINAWDYTSAKANFPEILAHYRHAKAPYLPAGRPQWSSYLLRQLQKWMDDGFVTRA